MSMQSEATNSQSERILAWLQQGHTITPMEALERFGCFRLGARIWDLRRDGHSIERGWQKDKEGRKRWAFYRMGRR